MRFHTEYTIWSLNGTHNSIEEQIEVSHRLFEEGIGPSRDGIKRSDIESELGIGLDFAPKTVIENLRSTGIVSRSPETFDELRTFVIATWIGSDGEIVNGEVANVAEEGIEAVIDHMQATDPTNGSPAVADGGTTVRDVLSSEFGVPRQNVEARLHAGDWVKNLQRAAAVLERDSEISTRDEYGTILFRNEAYRYTLTKLAMDLYKL